MGELVNKPHDRFFRHILQQPEAARALLRERLGPEVAAMLGPSTVVALDNTLVDRGLRVARPDKVLRARLRPDGPDLLYCVVEHKSAPDPRVAVQVLGYLWGMASLLDEERPPPQKLPHVSAIVVYHGRQGWKAPLSFRELVDWPKDVPRRSGADAQSEFFNVGADADEALSADPGLRAGLMAMKYATRPGERQRKARRLPRCRRFSRLLLRCPGCTPRCPGTSKRRSSRWTKRCSRGSNTGSFRRWRR